MITIHFEEEDLGQLYLTGTCKSGKYKNIAKDKRFVESFCKAIKFIEDLNHIDELRQYARFNYEQLKYQYAGHFSIRIIHSRIERLIFTRSEDGIQISILELNQDHYGNK